MNVETRTSEPELKPEVFEALVSIWTDILYADYIARHSEHPANDRDMMAPISTRPS
jgi:hypothetical protein